MKMAAPPGLYRIVERPIDLEEAISAVAGPDRGAIVTFAGVVRNHHAGREVLRVEYHAYAGMAEEVLRAIGRDISERFGTPHVAILHRVGSLAVGETSVIIAVASPHRREALAACAHAIERLKAEAPIWKKEHCISGAVWIEGPTPGKSEI